MIRGDKEKELYSLIDSIGETDCRAYEECAKRWDAVAHPLHGLGVLEDDIKHIAALTGSADVSLNRKAVVVCCADNGVVKEGISQTDSSVTGIVADNIAEGRSSVCRMAAVAGCDVIPLDLGIKDYKGHPGVRNARIGNGTGNICDGPAMTREQVAEAVITGIEQARLLSKDYDIIGVGEMGIGNTTTSAAVLSVLLGLDTDEVTGRGAGLSDEGFERKRKAVNRAVERSNVSKEDGLGVLAELSGFDLCGMCGLFIGGAIYRVPVIVDGICSQTAALAALNLTEKASCAMIASHISSEPVSEMILNRLGIKSAISAGMHLGEGTGAVALMPMLDMALAVYSQGYTFDDGGIKAYERFK